MARVKGLGTVRLPEDVRQSKPRQTFDEGWLATQHKRRVIDSDNDFIVVIAASSRSAVSGVGKTTCGIHSARRFDMTQRGFDARAKATLNPTTFARDILTDQADVPDQSSVLFDEAQGTLSSSGADSRRSMAQSVMDVTTALSTLRFRQITAIIISQSTKWIDKRIDDILDALVLIQGYDPGSGEIYANVYETFYNDLDNNGKRFTKKVDEITWPALSHDDPDYQYLHELKQQSALNNHEADEESFDLPADVRKEWAQELRNRGATQAEIADHKYVDRSQSWVSKNTEPPTEVE